MHALDQTRGFGEVMFGHAQLGDRRRVRRLVSVTNQLCKHPGGSLPDKLKAPKNEPLAKSRTRKSPESRLWLRGAERLPADWRLVDVCDQGADTFEFLEHEVHSGRRFVIRSWHDRQIYPGHQATGSTAALRTHMSSLRAIGGRTIDVAWQSRHGRRKARPARRAKLLISAGAVLVHPPRTKKGEHGDDPLPMWAVRVWEPQAPRPPNASLARIRSSTYHADGCRMFLVAGSRFQQM